MTPEEKTALASAIRTKVSTLFARTERRAALSEAPKKPKTQPEGPVDLLALVREDLGDCQRCDLCKTRKNLVFGSGSPQAKLMIIGEAPGAEEDSEGVPFVGPAGRLLDRMLSSVLELERKDVYVANVVKCRPPENRDPSLDELSACGRFLARQISAVSPRVILALGSIASKTLFETTSGVTRTRGVFREIEVLNLKVQAIATFHPAYLLRSPSEKSVVNGDLLLVKRRLEEFP